MKNYRSKYRWVNNGAGQGIPVHQIVAEKALGRALPNGAQVHHVDLDGHNNHPSNLVICPSDAYHKLLHVRTAALKNCGNANWLRCIRCKEYDDPANMSMYIPKDQTSPRAQHRACQALYEQQRKQKRKGV